MRERARAMFDDHGHGADFVNAIVATSVGLVVLSAVKREIVSPMAQAIPRSYEFQERSSPQDIQVVDIGGTKIYLYTPQP